MSLNIEVDDIEGVLLADGWHDVAFTGPLDDETSTFELDAYEFHHLKTQLHLGGQSDVCATGFHFTEAVTFKEIYGPLTAILALRVVL